MIPSYNYVFSVFLIFLLMWPVITVCLLIRDYIKGYPFKFWYRVFWPFMLFAELFS